MKDIETRKDIENLMNEFYTRALNDELIGYIFTDVAHLDLSTHLEIITDFWEMIVFGKPNFHEKYGRSPMLRHIELNQKEPLILEHFTRWLEIFNETIDKQFAGENADVMKFRAVAIANTMFLKVSQDNHVGVLVDQG